MGHRALVAYERPDGLYNLHYAHNGGLHLRLKQDITSSTPFGGAEATDARPVFDSLLALTDADEIDVASHVSDQDRPTTPVTLTPEAMGLTKEEILSEQLNYAENEAFYVVSSAFDVTAYRTHWFGLHNVADAVEDSPLFGNGALRTVRWYDGEPVGDGFTQGEFKALKRVAGDLLDRGKFTHEEALAYLEVKLVEWTDERAALLVRTPPESH